MADTSDTADPRLGGGAGSLGTPMTKETSPTSSNPGGGVTVPPGSISNDPYYQIQSGYINASSALQASDLARMIATAQAKYGLSSQEITNSLQNAQRGVTYDLANRQATESGDNAFYHNQASLLASFQQQGAQIDLNDFLAGAQSAFDQQQLTNQQNLSTDFLDAFYRQVQYQTGLAGGAAPTPAPPPATAS